MSNITYHKVKYQEKPEVQLVYEKYRYHENIEFKITYMKKGARETVVNNCY